MNRKLSTLFFLSIIILSIIAIEIPFAHAAGTRLYLPSAGAAAVSPAYQAAWENTSQAGTRLKCVTAKTVSAMASITLNEVSASANYDMLSRQYVSNPIAAQTISGTVYGQIRTSEANIAADADVAIIIYVVNNAGNTVRGTLLSYFPNAITNEFALTTLTNRKFPTSQALASVTAQDGDRIVIEVGTRVFNTITTAYNILHSYGDNSATDLAIDNSTTTANCPFIEFSQYLIFYQTTDYNGGWTAGNATGYAQGWIDGNATGYTQGYNAGLIDGNATGYIQGWNDGNLTGWISGNSTGWIQGNTTGYSNGWTSGNSTGYASGYAAGLLAGGGGSGTPYGGGAQLPATTSPIQITVKDWLNNPIKNTTITILDFYTNKTIGSNQTDNNGTATIKAPYTTLQIQIQNKTETIIAHTEKINIQTVAIKITIEETTLQLLTTPIFTIPLYWLIIIAAIILIAVYVLFVQKVN
jgi:hypothetical protein